LNKHQVIIDTDPGIDDAQAIAYAIAHPDIELLGLSTVFGNASVDITTRNALQLMEIFGTPNIPVAKGEAMPFSKTPLPAPDFVHGKDGMGNIDLDAPNIAAIDTSAAKFIVDQARKHPGKINVIAIGPLSNIARALELEPKLPSLLKQLIVMGGCVNEPGNCSPVAEANFINDPHAADLVCQHDWPLKVIGLDVTHKAILTDEHLSRIRSSNKKVGEFLWQSSRYYIDFYMSLGALKDKADIVRGCAMHDASAVVALVLDSAFTYAQGPARVASEGVAEGQLIFDSRKRDYPVDYWANLPDIAVAMDIDAQAVMHEFEASLLNYADLW